jgi:hypothetical protein
MTDEWPTPEQCGATLKSGRKCAFPIDRCPAHEQRRAAERAGGAPPVDARPPDMRTLARAALQAFSDSNLSPTLATRFVNAIKTTESMGEPARDSAETLREAAIMGGIMHGIPPRDREDWEMLEEIMDPYTMLMLYRWYPWTWYEDIELDRLRDSSEMHDDSPNAQIVRERKEWGEKHPGWEYLDELPEAPPWRLRIRSRHDANPPERRPGEQNSYSAFRAETMQFKEKELRSPR